MFLQWLTRKNKIFPMNSFKDIFISILILFIIVLYLYGYEICYLIYNADGLVGKERGRVLKNFWELRLCAYSFIIGVCFFLNTFDLSELNKSFCRVGFSLASISFFDKFFLREFDLSKYDSLIIFFVVFIEVVKFKIKKK